MNQPREDLDDDDGEDNDGEDEETYHEISPLTYQSNMKDLDRFVTPQRLSFQLGTMTEEICDSQEVNSGDDNDDDNDDDNEDDDDSEDRFYRFFF